MKRLKQRRRISKSHAAHRQLVEGLLEWESKSALEDTAAALEGLRDDAKPFDSQALRKSGGQDNGKDSKQ